MVENFTLNFKRTFFKFNFKKVFLRIMCEINELQTQIQNYYISNSVKVATKYNETCI